MKTNPRVVYNAVLKIVRIILQERKNIAPLVQNSHALV
jgi:hypothetical protein